jgi:hypothetical protein
MRAAVIPRGLAASVLAALALIGITVTPAWKPGAPATSAPPGADRQEEA